MHRSNHQDQGSNGAQSEKRLGSHSARRWIIIAVGISFVGFLLLSFAFLGATMVSLVGPIVGLQATETRFAVPSRSIEGLADELWRARRVTIPFSDTSDLLLVSNGRTALVELDQKDGREHLCVLDNQTGAQVWCGSGLPFVHSLASDGERLFVAVDWNVRCYDLFSGQLIWKTADLPAHTVYLIQPRVEGTLSVYSVQDGVSGRSQYVRSYDPEGGQERGETRVKVANSDRLLLSGQNAAYWTDGKRLWATKGLQGSVLWERKIDAPVVGWPIEQGGLALFRIGIFSRVLALKSMTGEIAWSFPDLFVSNVEPIGQTLYGITEDAKVAGLDVDSGMETDSVAFLPPETEQGTRSTAYYLQIEGDKFLLYFGDSQELIAIVH